MVKPTTQLIEPILDEKCWAYEIPQSRSISSVDYSNPLSEAGNATFGCA